MPFADASGWSEVIQRLFTLGYSAYAPANPLRGVISDGDHVRTFLSTIEGPVVLVGHSYGGSVITNASIGAPNVRALVYIAAYAPDEGETLGAAGALDGASNDLADHLLVRPYPGMPDGDGDAHINPEFYHEQFCADLPDALAARAGAHTVEISSSHVAFISHPQETVDLILAAVQGS